MLIEIETKSKPYNVRIGNELESFSGFMLEHVPPGPVVIITDEVVGALYSSRLCGALRKKGFSPELIEIETGEKSKSPEKAKELYSFMLGCGAERSTPVVGLGGGVIGDLAAFVASTYMRGVPFFNIPTSLIAQTDSSIGGKTGVNLPEGKNLVGTFYQPEYVHTDVNMLETLNEKEYVSGLAEVLKHALIKGNDFFSFLKENAAGIRSRDPGVMEVVVSECVKVKGDIVSRDEKEKGLRRILNLGHTLGHALESEMGYGSITHGEGVGIGMLFAARLSSYLGLCAEALIEDLKEILSEFNLPLEVPAGIDYNEVVKKMFYDKKVRGGRLEFVLPEKIGKIKLGVPVEMDMVKKVLIEKKY
ncbi:MAG: 3-dehydroquinate synthase [Elusimicrobiota bacterium]